MLSELRLIVGLGNPGPHYEYTRHNFGFLVLKHIAREKQWKWRRSLTDRSVIVRGVFADRKICLMMPLTYMNRVGSAVRKVVDREGVNLNDLLVVCDDFQLDFGQLRLRREGSSGGHNGLNSIIESLGTKDFARLRLGIGAPPGKQDPADYVLENFSAGEKKALESRIREAAECCLAWVEQDMEKVMSQFNKRKEDGKI